MKMREVGQKWRGLKSRFVTEFLTGSENSTQHLQVYCGQYTSLQDLKSKLRYQSSRFALSRVLYVVITDSKKHAIEDLLLPQ